MMNEQSVKKLLDFGSGKKIEPPATTTDILEQLARNNDDNPVVHEETGLTLSDVLQSIENGEAGIARIYAALFRDKFCCNTLSGRWMKYDGYWAQDKMDEHLTGVTIIKDFLFEVLSTRLDGYNTDYIAYLKKEIRKLNSYNKMQSICKLAATGADGLSVNGEVFDSKLGYAGAPNGTINLETGELLPNNPRDYITKRTGVPYEPDAPRPEQFMSLLHETFKYPVRKADDVDMQEFKRSSAFHSRLLIDYIQRLIGYAVMGTCREHIFPVLLGEGWNGKGVLVRTINKVLGDYGGEVQPEILLSAAKSNSQGPSPETIDLKGKRLVVASETNQGDFLNVSKVKRITGGDVMVGRALYANDMERFSPTHTVALQTNYAPNVTADDYAFWERVHVIPFLRTFVTNPDPENPFQALMDKDLEDKLDLELPGILKWIIDGVRLYRKEGLNPPECVKLSVEEYRKSSDYLAEFIEECCHVSSDYREHVPSFVKSLNAWRKERGARSVKSSKGITEQLKRKGFPMKKSSKYYYHGLELNSDGWMYRDGEFNFSEEKFYKDSVAKYCNLDPGKKEDLDI